MDKLFFETQYHDLLHYDDAEDRKALGEENKKPLANQNRLRINELEDKISQAKAVQSSNYKNERFRAEVLTYIRMLEKWMGRESKSYNLK